jgi:hypothetical protein
MSYEHAQCLYHSVKANMKATTKTGNVGNNQKYVYVEKWREMVVRKRDVGEEGKRERERERERDVTFLRYAAFRVSNMYSSK